MDAPGATEAEESARKNYLGWEVSASQSSTSNDDTDEPHERNQPTQSDKDDDGRDDNEGKDDEEGDDYEEDDTEDEEPRFKYANLTKKLGPVYRNGDATSSVLTTADKMVRSSRTSKDSSKLK